MSYYFSQTYFALFFIIALGIIFGHIKIKGISLDVSAIIFVALLMGHFGVVIPADFNKIGVILFIFTIGIQAGPGFFESFHRQGAKLIFTAIAIIFAGAVTAVTLALFFKIDLAFAVGLFAGALTSTPGLAAAIESTNSSLASIGYGIAYPFGVLGVILYVRLLPRILRVDLKKASLCYEQEEQTNYPKVLSANFIVENVNIDGKSLNRINLREIAKATLSRVMHDGIAVTPTKDTILCLGDRVRAVGTEEALERVRLIVGQKTDEEIPLSKGYDVQWVLVSNKNVAHKTVEQLNLLQNYNANITRIRRSGIDISPKPKSQIRFGDKLMIACDTESMEEVMKFLGNNAKRLSETDFLPIALGIVIGILLGSLKLPLFGGLTFSLGLTGGVLAAAIILSQIGKTGPIIWTMSGSANQLLRRLGLLFFLSAVGTEAGSNFFSTISQYGMKLFLVSAFITIIPLFVGTLVGMFFFKVNFLLLLGTLAGGMTSTPALAAIDPMSDCNTPQIAYATVYPIALVFVIICAQIIGKI